MKDPLNYVLIRIMHKTLADDFNTLQVQTFGFCST